MKLIDYFQALLTMLGAIGVVSLFVKVLGSQLVNQGSSLLNDLVLAFQRPDLPFHSFQKMIEPSQLIELLRASLGMGLGMVGGAFTSVFGTIFLVVIVVYRLLDNGATLMQLLHLLPIDVRGRFDRSVQKNVLALQVVITSVTL